VGVFPVGPSGVELTSSYKHRASPAYQADLGNALVNFARIVPQGLLVFFPSYAALKASIVAWEQPASAGAPSILDRIRRHKRVVVEPRDGLELKATVESYMAAIDEPVPGGTGGGMLLAVCRGKLSEGVDFADAACRAVVITGLPLPPFHDARVVLKRQYLDACRRQGGSDHLDGNTWYSQQALRAINQAVGRVIRHVHDYGAVLLCDSRFREQRNLGGLSLWLR